MKRKDSKLLAETRSVEKIIVRTSWPWEVPNPVRCTTPRHPPSGVDSLLLACRTLVPLNSMAFLWVESTLSFSAPSRSSMDSFKSGVDSPDNIASLTMQVPLISKISAGTVVSV